MGQLNEYPWLSGQEQQDIVAIGRLLRTESVCSPQAPGNAALFAEINELRLELKETKEKAKRFRDWTWFAVACLAGLVLMAIQKMSQH